MEFGRTQQVRMGVADVGDSGVTGQHRCERRTAGEPVIDH
jgi:hypothetical protein